jgi:hypothetical protein
MKRDTKHTQLTPDAFREIAEAAVAQVYEEADSMELHDVRTWNDILKRAVITQLEYNETVGVGDATLEVE